MKLSEDQKKAILSILSWYKDTNRKQSITLGGYAGTGKTTLISVLRKVLFERVNDKIKVAFCSYTGRATQNLRNKLEENKSIYWRDTVSTIHGLIYDPIENGNAEIVGWKKKEEITADLIIADEASMIDSEIWRDLLSYNIPILAVGDHGQLPPIKGSFNLMEKPELKLEQIHRQAATNPIIEISIQAREVGEVTPKSYGTGIVKYSMENDGDAQSISMELLENYNTNTLILCGYNSTRNKINQFIRTSLGFEVPEPRSGDRVICLRNNHEKNIYNGMLGTIISLEREDKDWYQAEISMDGQEDNYQGLIYGPQFDSPEPINFTKDRKLASKGDLFDFGYALTVHKAQGSQCKRVIMFEERFKQMDDNMWKRWLYTGITRAEEELYLFGK